MNLESLKRKARIAKVPAGWKLTTVGNSCQIRNDLRKPISVSERKKIQGKYPYYGPTGILGHINEYLVEGSYALIGEDGDHFLKHNGKDQTLLVDGRFNVNNHAHILGSTKDCLVEWFYHYFKNRNITPFLTRQGAGRYKLNKGTLRKLPILVPPLHEQSVIVDLLSTWDTAIEKTEKLIAAKMEYRKGLMQQLLLGKQRLPQFVNSLERKEARWGSCPVDWDYVRIDDIADQVSCKNKDGAKLPVLSCTKHHGLVDSLKYFGKQVFSKDLSTYKIVKRNQFAYATNHIEEGSIGYQDAYAAAVISPMYTVFETNEQIDDRFLFLLLKTELYRHIFEANTSASVDRRGSLRWKEFSKIHVPVPSIEEQRVIVEIFDLCDQELNYLDQQLTAFKTQKKGLMQKLLTGKVRINVPDEEVA